MRNEQLVTRIDATASIGIEFAYIVDSNIVHLRDSRECLSTLDGVGKCSAFGCFSAIVGDGDKQHLIALQAVFGRGILLYNLVLRGVELLGNGVEAVAFLYLIDIELLAVERLTGEVIVLSSSHQNETAQYTSYDSTYSHSRYLFFAQAHIHDKVTNKTLYVQRYGGVLWLNSVGIVFVPKFGSVLPMAHDVFSILKFPLAMCYKSGKFCIFVACTFNKPRTLALYSKDIL